VTAPPQSFNFADIWEWAADTVADRTAIVSGAQRRTYAGLETRANRLAHHLVASGVRTGDRVALYLRNGPEYIESLLAIFKIRALPVNVNFRYVAGELQALLDDAAPAALILHRSLGPQVAAVTEAGRHGSALLEVDDGPPPQAGDRPVGAVPYEEALAEAPDERPVVGGRGDDDHYLMYTGGTTGRPKGVLWRMDDAFFACLGGGDPTRALGPVERPGDLADRLVDRFCFLPIAPLMHAAAQWTTFMWLFAGGTVVLAPASFDPAATWQAVQDERVNSLTVIGDAVAKPLADALAAEPDRWDLSSLMAVSNGAAPLSAGLKDRIARLLPGVVITDGIGSTEAGIQGVARRRPGADPGDALRIALSATTTVLDPDDRVPIEPGSGRIGQLATSGHIPLGYFGDPEATARTFVDIDGTRWVLNGDMATVESDGSIRLLGRGSQCINTGGEKVFPEEVEAVLHGHPGVADVLVVGVPDERWGSAVCAVVQPTDAAAAPALEDLRRHGAAALAGFKLPKQLVLVDAVRRSPAGKADYRWAVAVAVATSAPA